MYKVKLVLKDGQTREFTRKFKSVSELKEWVYLLYIVSKIQNVVLEEIR